jgi:CRP-like cAMP-binding protein
LPVTQAEHPANDETESMGNENKIAEYISRVVALTDGEAEQFSSCFKEIKIKKRQFIVQPGFVVKHRNYVLRGAFRAYVVDDKGQDSTIAFAIDDWWITDYNSYILQKPATMFVAALEDSTILQISFENEQGLKQDNHKFETFFRIRAERTAAFMQQRIISNLTQTAEERYETFIAAYPQIVQRVPQYALASYLGMSTEFLSRIRNKRVIKKG